MAGVARGGVAPTARQGHAASVAALLSVALLLQALPLSATPLLSRRQWGYLSLGAAAWFAQESWQAHDRASDLSRLLKDGGTPAQAANWRAERKRSDKRTQAMVGLAGGAVAAGIYLLRTQDPDSLPEPQMGAASGRLHGLQLCLDSDVPRRTLGLRLLRVF